MIRAVLLAALAALALLPGGSAPAPRWPVDSYWLWAGVKPQPVLDTAARLYLLAAEVPQHDPRLVARRAALPRLGNRETWMVIRVETLAWTPEIHAQLLTLLARWRSAGNRIEGIQIDFDAATRGLETYAAFLRDLRARLPAGTKLGVTGLLDWSANGDPAGLDALAGTVDELVLQIYQGRAVIPGYQRYLKRLDRLRIPFRIGLVQGGEWSPPPSLESHPWFRGYVMFLVNPISP